VAVFDTGVAGGDAFGDAPLEEPSNGTRACALSREGEVGLSLLISSEPTQHLTQGRFVGRISAKNALSFEGSQAFHTSSGSSHFRDSYSSV